jgi:nitric-oxide synthase
MRLEVGGIDYTMAPFNGWYVGAEVGARNLSDTDRYDLLPEIARLLGLDTRRGRSLWRDRALVELNVAVLHSFERAGVRMVDHHTVSDHFLSFEEREALSGRATFAEWSWVVPPISGSTSPLFHHPFENREESPNFFYQPAPWRADGSQPGPKKCPFHPLLKRS